jgi:hypothetical protein
MGDARVPDKPKLYLESTIPSYLAAHPSRDLIVAAHQQITHDWWHQARPDYDLFISQAVLDEISAGDPGAAARRLDFVKGLPLLALSAQVGDLAKEYQARLGLPLTAQIDIIHMACAVVHRLDYLLTWNCTHIANGHVILRLQAANRALGHPTPVIITPEGLLPQMGGA